MQSCDMDRNLSNIRDIRHADIEALRSCIGLGDRVLEIGGGNGYQGGLVAGWAASLPPST